LQEFDLPSGDTLIGRGPDCRITLVDPLVSRHHARVRLEPSQQAVFEDLGSRNGSRVNGRLVRGTHALKDGDRIRIGTQELVFSEVDAVPLVTSATKRTGLLRTCAHCRMPYPEEMGSCPNCGSHDAGEEQTLSGILDDRSRQNWAVQMLIEMLRKALALGRDGDAERIMTQAMATMDERIRSASPAVDAGQLEALSIEAARLCRLQGTVKWARWMLDAYRRSAQMPTPAVVEAIADAGSAGDLPTLQESVQSLIASAPVNKLSPVEIAGLEALKTFQAKVFG
jgi:pSer/pThr/pTyr-binding forkhead associated (FHA) protein